MSKSPIRVAVTGAAGQIGYSLVFHIAAGQAFGPEQPVILQLIELPMALDALKGVAMEIQDCAFPLVAGIECTSDLREGFKDADVALLVGSKPRGKGQERADLIRSNGPIFVGQGEAIDAVANENVKVLVVGNPCNTNCLIARHQAKRTNKRNYTAMTRLDQNRAMSQLATKSGAAVADIKKLAVWGNHSPTMYPDFTNAFIDGKAVSAAIDDDGWLNETFIKTVQQRGKAIINARGKSSAASAAWAAVEHVRDWFRPTPDGEWVSMAVPSDGSYGVPEGLIYSFPCTVDADGEYHIVQGIELDATAQARVKASADELLSEREAVAELLG